MDLALENWWDESLYRKRLLQIPHAINGDKFLLKVKQKEWNKIPKLKHSHANWVKTHFSALSPEHNWCEYFKFCFVRDPIDRLYSIYNYHRIKLPRKYPEAKKAGSFLNWIKIGGTGSARVGMRSFVQDKDGNKLVDFIGKYENLQADWVDAFKLINLNPPELPHSENTRTLHGPTYSQITPDELDYINNEKLWRDDIEYFGYSDFIEKKFKEIQSSY